MKKVFMSLAVVAMVVAAASCGNNAAKNAEEADQAIADSVRVADSLAAAAAAADTTCCCADSNAVVAE